METGRTLVSAFRDFLVTDVKKAKVGFCSCTRYSYNITALLKIFFKELSQYTVYEPYLTNLSLFDKLLATFDIAKIAPNCSPKVSLLCIEICIQLTLKYFV